MSSEERIWYLEVNGEKEGPFSPREIRDHPALTPDILVWKPGFKKWVPIRLVKELRQVFQDDEVTENEEGAFHFTPLPSDEVVTSEQGEPPLLPFILLIIVALSLYLFYFLRLR